MDECSFLRRQLIRLYGWIIVIFTITILPIVTFFILPEVLFTIFFLVYIIAGIVFFWRFYRDFVHYSRITRDLIQKNSSIQTNQDFHAIIIAHKQKNRENEKFPDADYADGIDILIDFFTSHDPPIPFKIKEVASKKEAADVICDPQAQYLWIFGHGQRNMLGLQDGILCYKDLPNSSTKKFVGQYHCNSPFGTSLAERMNAIESDVTLFPRFMTFTRIAVQKKILELENKKLI